MVYRLGFVMEQTLGHVTHTQNFMRWAERDPEVAPTWILVPYESEDVWRSTPLIRDNWTLRASLRARAQVRRVLRSQPLDGLFFHTNVTALFAHRLMTQIPTVVSMDATPLNLDSIGEQYNHTPSILTGVESVKNALTRRTFRRARRLVVWNEWGKRSLVRDYGIDPGKVCVIPPGVDLTQWQDPPSSSTSTGRIRLLFVGGDFRRKGGEVLLQAFRHLADRCELDIVTGARLNVEGIANVRVHCGLRPNAPELRRLYADADIFVFPTLADVLPLVIMEAMASGLPVIATNVGGIMEQVDHGVTGFLVPPNDVHALLEALRRLVESPHLRRELGSAARRTAGQRFSGSTNYARLLEVCKGCVDQARADGTRP
jgi:glycosyltransferase involved in cell wall biosynthesis